MNIKNAAHATIKTMARNHWFYLFWPLMVGYSSSDSLIIVVSELRPEEE